jgi:hypothetical protein
MPIRPTFGGLYGASSPVYFTIREVSRIHKWSSPREKLFQHILAWKWRAAGALLARILQTRHPSSRKLPEHNALENVDIASSIAVSGCLPYPHVNQTTSHRGASSHNGRSTSPIRLRQ